MLSLTDKIIAGNFTREKALAAAYLEKVPHEVEKEIKKVRELVIFSAIELPDDIIDNLGRKARALFGKDLFIEVKVDTGLIGGAALVWKGRYRDYSLKAKFEEKKDILEGIYDQFIQDRRSWLCTKR